MISTMQDRKGAVRIADIPKTILRQLNAGEIESKTLAEGLAIDYSILLRSAVPQTSKQRLMQLKSLGNSGYLQRTRLAAEILLETLGLDAADRLQAHPSDTVRGWAAHLIGLAPLPLRERLRRITPFADDPHMGVRECAWLSLRPHIATEIETAIKLLKPWTSRKSPNLRRFATESTRPRGVWCAHIELLKQQPQIALPLLEPLRADEHKYVQDSLSNWLNDAAKSQPKFVKDLTRRWAQQGDCPATHRICKRALRSVMRRRGTENAEKKRMKSANKFR